MVIIMSCLLIVAILVVIWVFVVDGHITPKNRVERIQNDVDVLSQDGFALGIHEVAAIDDLINVLMEKQNANT